MSQGGERIVICGPSGSGKSTLIRCINALEEFQEGRDRRRGHRAWGRTCERVDDVRREVGMVFQSFNLFPHLTVLENCTLAPIWVRNIPEERMPKRLAMKFLERVKILHQANKYPGQMSGGQQQRVGDRPRADHELEGDAVRRTDLGARSRNGQGSARTPWSISPGGHDHAGRHPRNGFAREVANRVVFMDAGQVIEANTPQEFFANPQHARTQAVPEPDTTALARGDVAEEWSERSWQQCPRDGAARRVRSFAATLQHCTLTPFERHARCWLRFSSHCRHRKVLRAHEFRIEQLGLISGCRNRSRMVRCDGLAGPSCLASWIAPATLTPVEPPRHRALVLEQVVDRSVTASSSGIRIGVVDHGGLDDRR